MKNLPARKWCRRRRAATFSDMCSRKICIRFTSVVFGGITLPWPMVLGAGTDILTGSGSSPWAISQIRLPRLPKRFPSSPMGSLCISPQVCTPLSARNSPMPLAMPQRSVTGASARTERAFQGVFMRKLFGLLSLAAYFAVVLSPLRPIEHKTPPEASSTVCLTILAICSGGPIRRWQLVISKNASSTENTSTSGVSMVRASIMLEDTSA